MDNRLAGASKRAPCRVRSYCTATRVWEMACGSFEILANTAVKVKIWVFLGAKES